MDIPFEYVLPIIWGIQAGREYYVSICPVRLIPKLSPFDDEEIQPEMRAQRTIDLNHYAARPDSALNILYDHRDKKALLAKAVVKEVKVFWKLMDTALSILPIRSGKLFTLSSIYSATTALLAQHKDNELEQQIELAARYWNTVNIYIPDWEQVIQRKVSAGEMRQDYVHSHAIALAGLGGAGATLLSIYLENWAEDLVGLQQINRLRSSPGWKGRIMSSSRISKSRNSVSFMTAYIKKCLSLPLTPKEERLENARVLAGREE